MSSLLNTIALVLFSILFLLQGTLSLPVTSQDSSTNSSSNDTNNSTIITSIDCTLSATTDTDLQGIQSAHYVLDKYLGQVPRRTELCTLPLNYRSFLIEIMQTASPDITLSHIAGWYNLFTSFNNYLATIKSTVSDESDLLLLSTTQTLLDAVEQSYLNVLQDKACNCSSDCSIPALIQPADITCDNLFYNAHYYLKNLMGYAKKTLHNYKNNCNCQSPNGVTEREWFEAHFPTSNPDYYSQLDSLIALN
uniref:Uncharacterized protein n=1 Tax=Amphimedon queenslandica TaxID=400682 RepID=A0A1X7UQP2_AMPQE